MIAQTIQSSEVQKLYESISGAGDAPEDVNILEPKNQLSHNVALNLVRACVN